MKVQEVLENYNSLKASISIVEGEIQELENEVLDCKSANMDGMPKAKGFTSSSIENYIAEKQEKIEKKQRYIERTKTKLKIVENLVKTLKRYNQDIIEMKYYQMVSIEEIATKKDRGYGAIQKTIDRSIKMMQKEYNKNKMS
jgi:DNA-directed RNA polymerase specialized sigma24 family protein